MNKLGYLFAVILLFSGPLISWVINSSKITPEETKIYQRAERQWQDLQFERCLLLPDEEPKTCGIMTGGWFFRPEQR